MRIVIFAQFAGSPRYGMVYGHYYLAREWVRMGHQVSIISSSYSHTRFQQPESQSLSFASREIYDGIDYVWLKGVSYSQQSIAGRMLNIILFSLFSLVFSFFCRKTNLVISSSHHPFSIFASKVLAMRSKCTLVFEVRDLWPKSLILLGKLSANNIGVRVMSWVESYAYRTADFTVSVLGNSYQYMRQKGLRPEQFIYIPNGVDLTEQESRAEDTPLEVDNILKSAKAKFKFVIGYFGLIGHAQDFSGLFEALVKDEELNTGLVIVGDGPKRKSLEAEVSRLNLSGKVFFTGQVEKHQVYSLISRIDICYLGLVDSYLFQLGASPTKLNDYLKAAKPIIYSTPWIDPDLQKFCEAVFFCDPGDPLGAYQALKSLSMKTSSSLRKIGSRGQIWIGENRSNDVLARKFLEHTELI